MRGLGAVAALVVVCTWLVAVATADPLLDYIGQQANRTSHGDATKYPEQTAQGFPGPGLNVWQTGGAGGWTSGFFPGVLWQLYNLTGEARWHQAAVNWTEGIRGQQTNTHTHDVGFMVFYSFGLGWEFAKQEGYNQVLLRTAESLATRFNPVVGCTKSWDTDHACRLDPKVDTQFPVIIDNMLNLELLLWASANGGNATFREMAVSHASRTLTNHIRPDGSVYHVVDYNPTSGAVVARCTAQGYKDNSTWARGQSWCIHGFTMVYRYTGQSAFLEAAQRCANYWLDHLLPHDLVPLWDFQWDGPTGLGYRDTSAAAIAASGLAELATYVGDADRQRYNNAAVGTLAELGGSNYLSRFELTEGVLLHAIGNFPSNGAVDVSLIYGDYYLIELWRRVNGKAASAN